MRCRSRSSRPERGRACLLRLPTPRRPPCRSAHRTASGCRLNPHSTGRPRPVAVQDFPGSHNHHPAQLSNSRRQSRSMSTRISYATDPLPSAQKASIFSSGDPQHPPRNCADSRSAPTSGHWPSAHSATCTDPAPAHPGFALRSPSFSSARDRGCRCHMSTNG